MANFVYIRQKGTYGNGTPVLSAESVIGNESFAVMWGDEFIYAEPPRLLQMIKVWEKYGGIVISGVRIEDRSTLNRYGIAELEPVETFLKQMGKEGVVPVEKLTATPESLPDELVVVVFQSGAVVS